MGLFCLHPVYPVHPCKMKKHEAEVGGGTFEPKLDESLQEGDAVPYEEAADPKEGAETTQADAELQMPSVNVDDDPDATLDDALAGKIPNKITNSEEGKFARENREAEDGGGQEAA